MAAKTYKIRAVVIRKTRLGEKDLIVTMIDESGALVKGVAKGARKPGGSLAARLELFSTVDALMACGRSLDVVCEVRLVDVKSIPRELELSSCVAPIAELLGFVAQPDLLQPRLYEMGRAAIARIADCQGQSAQALAICAASLWKVMAQSGFRPSFTTCVVCGTRNLPGSGDTTAVSVLDGGAVCANCPRPADAIMVDVETVRWCEALIRSKFDEVLEYEMDTAASFEVLQLARMWIRAHTGRDLKSLDFLFTSGLF